MSTVMLGDLHIIEPVSYEAIKQRLIDLIKQISPETVLYESSDEMVLLEAFAYEMSYAAARFNTRLRNVLPSYASGENLDVSALNFYGVIRLDGESDEAFLSRSLASLQQSATTGSDNAYIAHTKSVDARISDVHPYRSAPGEVTVVWHSHTEKDEEQLQEIADKIERKLFDPKIRTLCTTRQSIVRAEAVAFDIDMTVMVRSVLEANRIIAEVTETIKAYFKNYPIAKEVRRSKIMSLAHVDGVEYVDLHTPANDVIIDHTKVAVLGSVNIVAQEVSDV